MIIQPILFIFAANNDNSSSGKDEKCVKEYGECLCRDCYRRQANFIDRRSVEWEEFKKAVQEYNEKEKRANENCIRRLVRNFFACFTSRTDDTSETTENSSVNTQQKSDETESLKSDIDD